MLTIENRTLRTIAAGVIATLFVTVSAISAMAAPSAGPGLHVRVATATKAATVKKATLVKKTSARRAAQKSSLARKIPLKAAFAAPTVLEDIVIERAPAKTAAAGSAFRTHFYRGQA